MIVPFGTGLGLEWCAGMRSRLSELMLVISFLEVGVLVPKLEMWPMLKEQEIGESGSSESSSGWADGQLEQNNIFNLKIILL